MARLIDADELKKAVEDFPNCYNGWSDTYDKAFIIGAIEEAPTIDAVSVVHGEWIGYNAVKGDDWLRSDGEPIFLVCNKCYGTVMNNTSAHWNFCPNCGAKMKGADDEV